MEAIAKFDFCASGEDELSFQAGDIHVTLLPHTHSPLTRLPASWLCTPT
uniref:SH3 domain-containing protein n=1 Tax=Nothoprocta perdicaria TaxID=30464 RepID=A0A8C6ZGC8_NOTPE